MVSPFQLYFNPILILKQGQVWRLVTTFLFFGTFGFNFFFNMIFTYKYCRMLEEGSFRGHTADFVLMFLFGGVCMIVSFSSLTTKKQTQRIWSAYCHANTIVVRVLMTGGASLVFQLLTFFENIHHFKKIFNSRSEFRHFLQQNKSQKVNIAAIQLSAIFFISPLSKFLIAILKVMYEYSKFRCHFTFYFYF